MQKHDEEKLRGMVMQYLPEHLNPTENESVGRDSWVEEYTQILVLQRRPFLGILQQDGQTNETQALNWLALKQVQREGA